MQEGKVNPRMRMAKEGSPSGCLHPDCGPGWQRGAAAKREAEGPALREPEPPVDGDLSQL